MSQPPILQLHEVSHQFSTRSLPAVEQVSFQLAQGDLLALLGPSGCGKTTLLRLIAGFEQPQSGSIRVAGRVVAGSEWVPPEQRDIGLVFQDFALFPHLSVAENIGFGLKRSSGSGRIAELIELVGLQGLEQRYPHELSGGQQQRVALARALAPRPALILLDEPLSNLDVQVRLYLREEIKKVLKLTHTTAIFVTHDQEEALAIADWVAVMQKGHIEQWGTPEQIYRDPASRFVAEFVTQANFLPVQRRGQGWESEVGRFELALDSPEQGDLMIRQEGLRLHPDDHGSVLIQDRLFLGREYCYCLQTPSGQSLHARTNQHLPIGQRVQLELIDPDPRVFASAQPVTYLAPVYDEKASISSFHPQ